MTLVDIAALFGVSTPVAGLLGVAVWRFSRLETTVKHNQGCTRLLVRAVSKLNVRTNRHTKMLEEHLNRN